MGKQEAFIARFSKLPHEEQQELLAIIRAAAEAMGIDVDMELERRRMGMKSRQATPEQAATAQAKLTVFITQEKARQARINAIAGNLLADVDI